MKFTPSVSKTSPVLTLGERFVPGAGEEQFCKPTGVAVKSNGDFYVSDGYCNGRIIMFNKDGRVLRKIGTPSGPCELSSHNVININAINCTPG